MKLLTAIDLAIDTPIDTKRLRALRGIMADFLGDKPNTDLLITLTPGWAQQFAQYLSTYPNRLKTTNSPYLSTANQHLYLATLRTLLRKLAASGAYPDIDPIQPLLDTNGKKTRSAATADLHSQLKRLCTLNLTGDEAALRAAYFDALTSGGLELNQLPTAESPTPNPQSPEKPKAATPAALRRFFAQREINLYQASSIFSDLLALALPTVGPDAIALAAQVRLLNPQQYLDNLPHYQALLSSTISDHGMLTQRWYALRSVSPKQTGSDIETAIRQAPAEISSLVSDTYSPNDLIIVERHGVRTKRNHPAVRNLLFLKTLRPSIPRILKYVGDAAAYKRTSDAADGYFPVPYSEIYRMKLVLGAVGADDTTEIYTNAELRSHFSLDPLAVGDLVTIAKPGFEHFTAQVLRLQGRDHYCVTFPDFNFNLVLPSVPRALITPLKAGTC